MEVELSPLLYKQRQRPGVIPEGPCTKHFPQVQKLRPSLLFFLKSRIQQTVHLSRSSGAAFCGLLGTYQFYCCLAIQRCAEGSLHGFFKNWLCTYTVA